MSSRTSSRGTSVMYRACRKCDLLRLSQDPPELGPPEVLEAGYGGSDLLRALVLQCAREASVHYLPVHAEDGLKRAIAWLLERREWVARSIPDGVSFVRGITLRPRT